MEADPQYQIQYIDHTTDWFYPIRVTDVAGNIVPFVINDDEARALLRWLAWAIPAPEFALATPDEEVTDVS